MYFTNLCYFISLHSTERQKDRQTDRQKDRQAKISRNTEVVIIL